MRNEFRMSRVVAVFLAAAVGMMVSQTADAQSDFFKRGSDLLRQLPGGSSSSAPSAAALSDSQIGAGLREALKVGVETVVEQVGAVNGYNADPRIHVPLPNSLKTVQSTLSRIGLSGMVDDLELRLNRAAEANLTGPRVRDARFRGASMRNTRDASGEVCTE